MKARATAAVLVFFIILASPFLVAGAKGEMFRGVDKPELDPAIEGPCVKKNENYITDDIAKEEMRINHMKILKDEREAAVRDGERNEDHSLRNCFKCHENEEEFCDKCHEYSGVSPNCFDNAAGCHSTEPSSADGGSSR